MDQVRALTGHERNKDVGMRRFPIGKTGKRTSVCFTHHRRVSPGLHRTIQKRWFPKYRVVKKQGGCSSRAIGSRVDQQLLEYARTGRIPKRPNKYTKIAIDFFRKNKIKLQEGQVMIASDEKGFATAIDLIGVRTEGVTRPQFFLIEIKTGYSVGATRSQGTLAAPLDKVPNTQQAHHQLQLLTMDELLQREYRVTVHRAIVLYLQEDARTKKVTAFAAPYPEWCRTRGQRRAIWDAM